MPDGKLKITTREDLVVGAILREVSKGSLVGLRGLCVEASNLLMGISPQFSDSIIIKLNGSNAGNSTHVRLGRPHAMVTPEGTLYQAVEEFEVPAGRLIGEDSIFRTVCRDSGTPVNVCR